MEENEWEKETAEPSAAKYGAALTEKHAQRKIILKGNTTRINLKGSVFYTAPSTVGNLPESV